MTVRGPPGVARTRTNEPADGSVLAVDRVLVAVLDLALVARAARSRSRAGTARRRRRSTYGKCVFERWTTPTKGSFSAPSSPSTWSTSLPSSAPVSSVGVGLELGGADVAGRRAGRRATRPSCRRAGSARSSRPCRSPRRARTPRGAAPSAAPRATRSGARPLHMTASEIAVVESSARICRSGMRFGRGGVREGRVDAVGVVRRRRCSSTRTDSVRTKRTLRGAAGVATSAGTGSGVRGPGWTRSTVSL